MEPLRLDTRTHGSVTEPRGAPAVQPIPRHVVDVLSHLAHLIDDRIALRGSGIGVRDFAARVLGVDTAGISQTSEDLGLLEYRLVALALAAELEAAPPTSMIGSDIEEPPEWDRLELGDEHVRIPRDLAAAFAPGSVAPVPLVVQTQWVQWRACQVLTVYARIGDEAHAARWLSDLIVRARQRQHPYRLRVLEATSINRGLDFAVVSTRGETRADLVLPERLWLTLDRNVGGLFRSLDRLRAAGLATNRGVLLAGPPGTGKTALCRVLATELAGQVTVVFCDARVVADGVHPLYAELAHLAPALVVMEDVDLVIGDRAGGGGQALVEFLVALDGAMSTHEGVVTIATTNAPGAIDAAARRSSRFDVLVEVPPPDHAGRAAILRRYLRDLGLEADVGAVASLTDGATGADLRELVSDAVLHSDGDSIDPGLLVSLARQRGSAHRPGQYL